MNLKLRLPILSVLQFFGYCLLILAITEASYRFIEMPCMRLSRDMARRIWKRPTPVRAAASATS